MGARGDQAALERPGGDVAEVHLVPADHQLHPEHAAPAQRLDDPGRDRPGGVQRGGGHVLRLPVLLHVTNGFAVADRRAEVERRPRRPDTAHREQGDVEVDLDQSLGQHPAVGQPATGGYRPLPGRLEIARQQDHRLPLAADGGHRLHPQRVTGVVGDGAQLVERSREPERRGGQAQLVGGQPAHALPVGGEPGAVRGGTHLGGTGFGHGDQRVVGDGVGGRHHEMRL